MIHHIHNRNRALYGAELDALHRARKAVFVDELGWKLRVRDGMEHDEYDDDRASHLVGFDASRDVAMSIRVRPADDRSMLVDHFSHFIPAGMRPVDDGRTWEVTRGFCRETGLRRVARQRRAACMLAPLELALRHGVDRFVGFTDVRTLGIFYHFGWKMTLLGDPQPYGEGDGVVFEAEVSQQVVDAIRTMWGLPRPSFLEISDLGGRPDVHHVAAEMAEADPLLKQLAAPPPAAQPAHGGREAAGGRRHEPARRGTATPIWMPGGGTSARRALA
jgi:acyl homoserine lactone synthase